MHWIHRAVPERWGYTLTRWPTWRAPKHQVMCHLPQLSNNRSHGPTHLVKQSDAWVSHADTHTKTSLFSPFSGLNQTHYIPTLLSAHDRCIYLTVLCIDSRGRTSLEREKNDILKPAWPRGGEGRGGGGTMPNFKTSDVERTGVGEQNVQ